MEWTKAPAELEAAFEAALPVSPAVVKRKLFGYPAAFVNGNMFAGLHQSDAVVRLPESERTALLAQGGQPFEPMAGRPMRGYVVLPEAIVADPAQLATWLERALVTAAALPPKPVNAAKASTGRTG